MRDERVREGNEAEREGGTNVHLNTKFSSCIAKSLNSPAIDSLRSFLFRYARTSGKKFDQTKEL